MDWAYIKQSQAFAATAADSTRLDSIRSYAVTDHNDKSKPTMNDDEVYDDDDDPRFLHSTSGRPEILQRQNMCRLDEWTDKSTISYSTILLTAQQQQQQVTDSFGNSLETRLACYFPCPFHWSLELHFFVFDGDVNA